jgi:hypothetical protein
MKTFVTAAIVLFLAGTAAAADYLVYKDSSGRIVLSNFAPPGSAEIVARHQLTDATDAEIAATEKANQEIAKLNVLRDMANSYERLVEANMTAYTPRPILVEWNQVAVSTGLIRRHR